MFVVPMQRFLRYLWPVLIMVIGVALSVGVFRLGRGHEHDAVHKDFETAAHTYYGLLEREINLDLSAVESVADLYNSSDEVTRAAFATFTTPLLQRHPSIQALEWIPRVADAGRESYEAAAKRDGFPDFEITQRQDQGKMARAARQDEYFPVYYVEPYQGNEVALGYDLSTNAVRQAALEQARDTGRLVATARITLVQETANQSGFLAFAPIYRGAADSVWARRENLVGFVLGAFRVSRIVDRSLSPHLAEHVRVSLYDESAPQGEGWLYSLAAATAGDVALSTNNTGADPGTLQYAGAMDVGGRRWSIRFVAAPGYLAARRSMQSWEGLAIGLLVTTLLVEYVFVNASRNVSLQQEIDERKQAEEGLRRRADELAALHATSLDIAGPHELADLLEAVVARTARLLNVAGGGLYLCDPDRQEVRCLVSYHTLRDYTGTVLRYGEGAAGIVAQTGQPLMIDDYRTWPGRADHFEEEQPFAALLSAPMIWQGQVTGVIHILHNQEGQRFSQADLDLLMRFADHAALAVANTHLMENERSQRALAEGLRDTAAALASTLSLEEVLDRILTEVGRVVPHDAANIMLLEDGMARIVAGMGYAEHGLEVAILAVRAPIASAGHLRRMAESGEPLAIPDTRTFPGWPDVPETQWIRSYAGAPIRVQGILAGYLNLDSAAPGFFNQSHAERLRAFADQASAAIERAQLYEASRRHSQELEQRVAERTAELSQREAALSDTAARLQAANGELARAARLKDEFLANMSHELRTPLNAILGLSEALQEQVYGPLNERQHKSLAMIEESGRHLLTLINDILDLSKIEAGMMELQLESVDVAAVCQASLQFIKQTAFKKRIMVRSTMDSQAKSLQSDERRLKQILVNLLSNAVKFTPEGGTIGLEVVGDAEQEGIRFTVWDTGIGIAPDHMERIFQPFVQVDSSFTRQYAGTGLGLALVRRLVDRQGGSITLESEPGHGSRFTITLPWQPSMQAPAEAIEPRTVHPAPTAPFQRALVVEDSPSAAEQLVRYLAEWHIWTTVQARASGIIERVLAERPDLIILDILLPDRSGWEVLTQLKADARTRPIPVLVISVVDDAARGLALGAVAYLVKPIARADLQMALSKIWPGETMPRAGHALVVLPDRDGTQPGAGPAGPTILLAEDNETSIAVCNDYLLAKGYRMQVARNGQQAVALAQQARPDLILMDIQMPGLDGMEAIRRIRGDGTSAGVPIIALTALAMPGDRDRCLAAGADEYLTKPVNLQCLVCTIEALLTRAPEPTEASDE